MEKDLNFKPMLSGKIEVNELRHLPFPVLVSPKLDGIRAIKLDGVLVSRNLKPIPNRHTQKLMEIIPDGFDGELIVGDPYGKDVWNRTQSGIMSEDGEPDVRFYVFDDATYALEDDDVEYAKRLEWLKDLFVEEKYNVVAEPLIHYECKTPAHVLAKEVKAVDKGFEGVMIRTRDGGYKFGRSGKLGGKTGWLFKLKRWHDMEATVVDVVEQMHNGNEAKRDELGRTKRSSAKAGKSPKGMLGALVCEVEGTRFELGTGFTDAQRKALWKNQPIGELAKFKYQERTPDGSFRFPVYIGLRSELDA